MLTFSPTSLHSNYVYTFKSHSILFALKKLREVPVFFEIQTLCNLLISCLRLVQLFFDSYNFACVCCTFSVRYLTRSILILLRPIILGTFVKDTILDLDRNIYNNWNKVRSGKIATQRNQCIASSMQLTLLRRVKGVRASPLATLVFQLGLFASQSHF